MRVEYAITAHAVEQYEARVLACPERKRSDEQLRSAMRWQIRELPMLIMKYGAVVISAGPLRPKRSKPWEMTINYPTHLFVVDGGSIVTTLGFMMRPKKTAVDRSKRRGLARYRQAAKRLFSAQCLR